MFEPGKTLSHYSYIFYFLYLTYRQIHLAVMSSIIHSMPSSSIPFTVECHFPRSVSVGRYSFKIRVQNSFMILLMLFPSFSLWLLLILLSGGSPAVIPVKKCLGVKLPTSRMSHLTDVRGLLLSKAKKCWETVFLEFPRSSDIEEESFAHPNERFPRSTLNRCSWWSQFPCNLFRLCVFLYLCSCEAAFLENFCCSEELYSVVTEVFVLFMSIFQQFLQ